MNREKQIEEMVIALTESQHEFDKAWHECLHNGGKQPERENVFYANYLVENKGYRKASEIFEEIEEQMNAIYKSVQYGCYSYMRYGNIGTDSPDAQRQLGKLEGVKHLGNAIAELKKKYTEDE